MAQQPPSTDPKTASDIPCEPAVRDREAERARASQIPGDEEARAEAAREFRWLRQLLGARKHLPALATLRRNAEVLDCEGEINLVPRRGPVASH